MSKVDKALRVTAYYLQRAIVTVSSWQWGPFWYMSRWQKERFNQKPVTERLRARLAYKV